MAFIADEEPRAERRDAGIIMESTGLASPNGDILDTAPSWKTNEIAMHACLTFKHLIAWVSEILRLGTVNGIVLGSCSGGHSGHSTQDLEYADSRCVWLDESRTLRSSVIPFMISPQMRGSITEQVLVRPCRSLAFAVNPGLDATAKKNIISTPLLAILSLFPRKPCIVWHCFAASRGLGRYVNEVEYV